VARKCRILESTKRKGKVWPRNERAPTGGFLLGNASRAPDRARGRGEKQGKTELKLKTEKIQGSPSLLQARKGIREVDGEIHPVAGTT